MTITDIAVEFEKKIEEVQARTEGEQLNAYREGVSDEANGNVNNFRMEWDDDYGCGVRTEREVG